MKADPQLLRYPIALLDKEVVLCSAATDIFNLTWLWVLNKFLFPSNKHLFSLRLWQLF
ncbi:MAG: hypothetical protein HC912_08290 [Saprospiraceae bacterium]|nr:hypothetical protein [Saprospiraceae bacterium]